MPAAKDKKTPRRIPEDVKLFIVKCHAHYLRSSEVEEAVVARYGYEVSRQFISMYNPQNVQFETKLKESEKYRTYYNKERAKFNEQMDQIPIANQVFRLKVLDQMLENHMRQDPKLATALLEQAAKEVGGAYTNKQQIDNISSNGSMTPVPALDENVAKAIAKKLDDEY